MRFQCRECGRDMIRAVYGHDAVEYECSGCGIIETYHPRRRL